MKQEVIVVDVEFHGFDGFVDVALPSTVVVNSPPQESGLLARLNLKRRRPNVVTCAIFSPHLSADADDRTVKEYYKVGVPSKWALWLNTVARWNKALDGAVSLEQGRGIHTVVSGQVTGVTPDADLVLDCGMALAVSTSDIQGPLPTVGEWITVEGDLFLSEE